MNKPLSGAELNELVSGLHKLSRNLWWSWNQEAQDFFYELSPRGWQNMFHNAVAVLREVSEQELRARLQDMHFAARARAVLGDFQNYLGDQKTWCHLHAARLHQHPVAYFSAEFGFHESLPISAGGLGILAGDHAKSASDLGLGFVGVGLFYREGYFQQSIDSNNWQTEYYNPIDPHNVPLEPVLDADGERLVCSVGIGMNAVDFQVWRVNVGRVPVFLLDTNLPENEQRFRDLTTRVYGGDSITRIMQEILLGIGGHRALEALGLAPTVYHMNEGHSAFLSVEWVRRLMEQQKLSFAEARDVASAGLIFTTHTPVPAGHDYFPPALVNRYLGDYIRRLGLSLQDFLGLGRQHADRQDEEFCMTVLALRMASASNGVSKLHGEVSRSMWKAIWPGVPQDEIPIGHVTKRGPFPFLDFGRDESALRSVSRAQMARGTRRLQPVAARGEHPGRRTMAHPRASQGKAGSFRPPPPASSTAASRGAAIGDRRGR